MLARICIGRRRPADRAATGLVCEKGGYWAMNPGYDRPDHEGFRRPISYDCMFCHNAYPKIPAGMSSPRRGDLCG